MSVEKKLTEQKAGRFMGLVSLDGLWYLQLFSAVTKGVVVHVEELCSLALVAFCHSQGFFDVMPFQGFLG